MTLTMLNWRIAFLLLILASVVVLSNRPAYALIIPPPPIFFPTNDLQISSFSFAIKKNGIVTTGSPLGYFSASDHITADFTLSTTWNCGTYDFVTHTCQYAKPGSFAVQVKVKAGASTFLLGTYTVQPSEVTYRNFPAFQLATHASFNAVSISSPAFEAWAAPFIDAGTALQFQVDVDTANQLFEISEINNGLAIAGRDILPLSGAFHFGSVQTSFQASSTPLVAATGVCGVNSGSGGTLNNVHLNAAASWIPASNGLWNTANFNLTNYCAAYRRNGNVFDLFNVGTFFVNTGAVNGTLGGFAVSVSNSSLKSDGAHPSGTMRVTLPENLTYHANSGGKPVPKGVAMLSVSVPSLVNNDYSTLSGTLNTGFLHSEMLPFSIAISNLTLDSTGLSGNYASAIYLHDRTFALRDLRQPTRNGVVSNDIRFSMPAPPAITTFNIDPATGLKITQVDFKAFTSGVYSRRTHFPSMGLSWDAFSVAVAKGRLVDKQRIGAGSSAYSFNMSSDCARCSSNSPARSVYNPVLLAAEGLGWDGAVSAPVNGLVNPFWGAWDTANALNIFTRTGDSTHRGVLYLPGFVAQGTGGLAGATVPEYLLGMRQVASVAGTMLPATFFALQTTTSRRGNYFMAGINLGPELYSQGATKQPFIGLGSSLAGTSTKIGFGGVNSPNYQTAVNNVGAKYVTRRGGLTGVFNSSTPPQPMVYGYALRLDRFAFRMVSNVLDDYSWIDGMLNVPGKGLFDVFFESLALECSGNIDKGVVPKESVCGDGINNNNNLWVDENCGQSLAAWQTNIDVQSISFVPEIPGTGVCAAQNRLLQVGNDVELKALQKRLGMLATWSPAGDPANATVSGSTDHVLDQPASPATPDEAMGFAIALNSGISLKTPGGGNTNGWFAIDGDIAAPFWESIKASSRIANKTGTSAEKSIIIDQGGNLSGSIAADDGMTNAALAAVLKSQTSPNFKVHYQWGDTGFGFGLPVYYDSALPAAGKRPSFLGRTVGKDLWVMQVNSGVDFVTPRETKISFGASADFDRLANAQISLDIDLNDPASVAKIDAFLGHIGVGGNPVGTLVGTVTTATNQLNAVAGAKLDEFLKDKLRASLDLINPDPFKLAADAMGKVQSIPEQLASSVSAGLSNLTSQIINPLSSGLDQKMLNVYNSVPDLMIQAQIDPAPVMTQLDQFIGILDQADSMVSQVGNTLNHVDQEVGNVTTQINDLVNQVNAATTGSVDKATSAIDTVTTTISNVSNFQATLCGPGSEVRTQVAQFETYVQQVKSTLRLMDMVSFASTVGSVAGIDMSGVTAAQSTINNLVADLDGRITTATASLDNVLSQCVSVGGSIDYGATLNDALAFLTQVRNTINQVKAAMTSVQTTLLDPATGLLTTVRTNLDAANQQVTSVRTYIGEIKDMLLAAKQGFPDSFAFSAMSKVQIQAQMDQTVSVLTGGNYTWHYGVVPSEHTFIQQMATDLRLPIDAAIANAAAAASAQLTPLVSLMPHPTSDEMKEMVVDFVMNSPAVETVTTEVNKFFLEITDELNTIVMTGFDQVNHVIKDLAKKLEDQANQALQAATAPIKNLPVKGGEIDGYALMVGDELDRLHIGAEWTMKGDSDDNTTSYNAALDITSWNANNKGANCGTANPSSLLDAQISTTDLPITVAGSTTLIKQLYLGFTLDGTIPAPVGLFGGISINGAIDFEAFQVFDPAFAAGVGAIENYVGASAAASFDSLQLELAFLVGKTCNADVLAGLDPNAAEFITLPGGVFNGGYARGAASIPIWNNGCALTVGVGAEVGAWVLIGPPLTIGGVVGGSAYGKAICIAALRGQVTAYGEKSGDQYKFQGDGFGVGGIGFCSPSKWTTIERSRKDKWCGTGDASFGATYNDGWDLIGPRTSAVH